MATAHKHTPFSLAKRIKNEALRRKAEGGFLPTIPADNEKWLSSHPDTLAQLLAFNTAETLPSGLDLQALDGTRYALNTKAKIASAIQVYTDTMAAIDAAEMVAQAARRADPKNFDFDAIVWPPIFTG
jgi:hypothetical protein